MRRGALALAVLGALLLQPSSARAQFPTPTLLEVSISGQELPGQSIGGRTDPAQMVDVKVVTPGGRIKAIGRDLSDAGGSFGVGLLYSQMLEPGDRVEIQLGENPDWTYDMVYSRLRITGFDFGAGTVSGIVTPRKPRIHLVAQGMRLIPDPASGGRLIPVTWETAAAGKGTDPTGRFTVKPRLVGLGWEGTYRRIDTMRVWYRTYPVSGNPAFSFTVNSSFSVPGIEVFIGGNLQILMAVPGRNYAATLLAPGGAVKGTAPISGIYPVFIFRAADGTSVAANPGDEIRISGLGGFTTRVPRLGAGIDTARNRVRVFGPANTRIQVACQLFGDDGGQILSPEPTWVKTDAAGTFTLALPGFDIRHGDRVSLTILDGRGNIWVRQVQSVPAAD